jgi:hypothetical protein
MLPRVILPIQRPRISNKCKALHFLKCPILYILSFSWWVPMGENKSQKSNESLHMEKLMERALPTT